MSSPPPPIEWRTESGEEIPQPSTDAQFDAASLATGVTADERRMAIRLRFVVILLIVAALGVTWAMGGLRQRPRSEADGGVPTVAVHEPFDGGPWTLTVTDAALFTSIATTRPTTEGNRLLAVAVTAEVTAERTYAVNNAISLSGVAGLVNEEPLRMLRMSDATLAFDLQPGLPERVAYIWEISADAPAPEEIVVVLNGANYRRANFYFLNETMWWDAGPRARVVVPVEDRT